MIKLLTNCKKHVFSLKAPIQPKNATKTMTAPAVHIIVDGSKKKSKASFTTLCFRIRMYVPRIAKARPRI